MRATSVSRTKLIAACAATAFAIVTATAQAAPMAAGTWEGQITGGTLALGDGDYHTTPITVPGGTKFTFTIPAGSSAPVAFTAPAMHIDIPVRELVESGTTYRPSGTVDLSVLSGTIDPATGAATAQATAHGIFQFAYSSTVSGSMYCYFGNATPPATPQPPVPIDLNLAGTGTLTDSTFAATVDCADAIPPGFDSLRVLGHLAMPTGNALTLNTTFTHIADPPAANQNTSNSTTTQNQVTTTTTTTTTTGTPVRCVVPTLKGLKLAKARTAAKKAHCAVGTVKRKKSGKKATTVLKQGKKAGTVLAKGSKIALTVAKK
jgi:hypothetical protein